MTKRETCEWAEPASVIWSKCLAPLPPCVSKVDRFADDVTCGHCPCWKEKEPADAKLDVFTARDCADTVDNPSVERIVRVRILDDAAVERAIAALRTAIDTAEKLYDLASEEAALYKDAIRDLGGKT